MPGEGGEVVVVRCSLVPAGSTLTVCLRLVSINSVECGSLDPSNEGKDGNHGKVNSDLAT